MTESPSIERMIELQKKLKVSNSEYAKKLKISRHTLTNIYSEKTKMSLKISRKVIQLENDEISKSQLKAASDSIIVLSKSQQLLLYYYDLLPVHLQKVCIEEIHKTALNSKDSKLFK